MIKEWLDAYQPANMTEASQALREIMQEIALAGLQRAGFFEKAAFHGETALRIFYGLPRFSENLDFSLLEMNPDFDIDKYMEAVRIEFESLGMKVSIRDRHKTNQYDNEPAFLKFDTVWKELVLEHIIPQLGLEQDMPIKIILEIDRVPSSGFETEEKLLLRPFSSYVKCLTIADLLAWKMHVLLFRRQNNSVKGRDLYDMEWYIKKGVSLHLPQFVLRAKDCGNWHGDQIVEEEFSGLLRDKISSIDMNRAKADIGRFIPDQRVLDIWSPAYFLDLVSRLKITA